MPDKYSGKTIGTFLPASFEKKDPRPDPQVISSAPGDEQMTNVLGAPHATIDSEDLHQPLF